MSLEQRDGGLKDEVREHFELKKLKERVLRLEAENKELKMGNSILQTQYSSQCETQSEILRTLHSNLDDNYTKIEEQERKIAELDQHSSAQEQEHKDDMEREKIQWQIKLDELRTKNADLQVQLDKERDFQRPTLEAELASLKQQIVDLKEAHRNEESAFERKKAIDFDALRRDMEDKVNRTREFLKLQTRDQLKTTTKRTIMENQQKATELIYQNSQTEKIMDQNNRLLEENAQLRRKISIHKDLENELARRTHVYQKLIKKMEMSKSEASTMEDSIDAKKTSVRNASSADTDAGSADDFAVGNGAANAALAEENAQLKRQVDGTTSNLQMVRHEFAQYRRDHATLTQLQDQSTRLIISALYELKNQRECVPFPPATYDENATWQFVSMNPRQKEYFFRMLLERLNSSMCASCFPMGPQAGNGGAVGSTGALPAVGGCGKQHQHGGGGGTGGNFSQFLWSVATQGGPQQGAGSSGKEMATKCVQTETSTSDPCLKEGMWSLQSRSRFSDSPATPAMVKDSVRPWGQSSMSQRPRVR